MSHDCADHDEDDEFYSRPGPFAEPFVVADVVCIGFRWIANILTCAGEAVETTAGAVNAVANCVGMHANHQRQRARIAREMGMAIEKITGGPS